MMRLLTCCTLLVVFQQVPSGADEHSGESLQTPDLLCGPRCLHYLLRHLQPDQPQSLNQVVQELQQTGNGRMTSLADLQRVLQAKGIECEVLSANAPHALNADVPVITHTILENGSGHFVIWHPSSTRWWSVIWDGLNEFRIETPRQFRGSVGAGFLVPLDREKAPDVFCLSAEQIVFRFALASVVCSSGFIAILLRRRDVSVSGRVNTQHPASP
ncbi:MAG: hypothetical protein KDA96_15085 [Planctomycetaceae bacterium]|nr:hypothetical protein [Planctomycetaceae bacterium]